MNNGKLIDSFKGRNGHLTVMLTKAGADLVFEMRTRSPRVRWEEIAVALDCSRPTTMKAARDYFGDNQAIFGRKQKKETPPPAKKTDPEPLQMGTDLIEWVRLLGGSLHAKRLTDKGAALVAHMRTARHMSWPAVAAAFECGRRTIERLARAALSDLDPAALDRLPTSGGGHRPARTLPAADKSPTARNPAPAPFLTPDERLLAALRRCHPLAIPLR